MDGVAEESDCEVENKRQHLPLRTRVAFATGNFLNVLAISMWFPYNVSFFQKVLLLPPKSAGTIVLVAQIGGAVSTPFIGVWSDQCICKVPGRRKIFQLIGVISLACSFFFIWYDCLGCSTASSTYQVLYYSCFAIVFEFGWAATQIGQLALIPELTIDKTVQVELNSIRYGFQVVANLLVFSSFWGLLEKFNGSVAVSDLSPGDGKIFWIMAVVVIAVGLPVSMIFQVFVPERCVSSPSQYAWYKWLVTPKFYLTACAFVAARLIVILPQTYIPLYLIDTLKMDRVSIAKGPLILYCSSFVSTLVIKRFSKTIGEKMTLFFALAVVWGALIWFWIKEPTDDSHSKFNWKRDSVYGATMLLGAGGAVVLVVSMSMIAHLVGSFQGSSAFVYGWMVFADRLSNGVAVKIIQQFQPEHQSQLPDFFRNVLVTVPFVGSAVGLVAITLMALNEIWKNRVRTRQLSTNSNLQDTSSTSKQYGTMN